jgi:hypothetical protein
LASLKPFSQFLQALEAPQCLRLSQRNTSHLKNVLNKLWEAARVSAPSAHAKAAGGQNQYTQKALEVLLMRTNDFYRHWKAVLRQHLVSNTDLEVGWHSQFCRIPPSEWLILLEAFLWLKVGKHQPEP